MFKQQYILSSTLSADQSISSLKFVYKQLCPSSILLFLLKHWHLNSRLIVEIYILSCPRSSSILLFLPRYCHSNNPSHRWNFYTIMFKPKWEHPLLPGHRHWIDHLVAGISIQTMTSQVQQQSLFYPNIDIRSTALSPLLFFIFSQISTWYSRQICIAIVFFARALLSNNLSRRWNFYINNVISATYYFFWPEYWYLNHSQLIIHSFFFDQASI